MHPRLLQLCQSGKISPNLVTLNLAERERWLNRRKLIAKKVSLKISLIKVINLFINRLTCYLASFKPVDDGPSLLPLLRMFWNQICTWRGRSSVRMARLILSSLDGKLVLLQTSSSSTFCDMVMLDLFRWDFGESDPSDFNHFLFRSCRWCFPACCCWGCDCLWIELVSELIIGFSGSWLYSCLGSWKTEKLLAASVTGGVFSTAGVNGVRYWFSAYDGVSR